MKIYQLLENSSIVSLYFHSTGFYSLQMSPKFGSISITTRNCLYYIQRLRDKYIDGMYR